MVPLAARDHSRLREAAALRGPAAAPVGRAALLRRLVAGALDRSVEVAATLELRGYANGPPGRAGPAHPSRHDRLLQGVASLVVAAAIIARATGACEFRAYPTLSLDTGVAPLAFAAGLLMAAGLPFARRSAVRTRPWRVARA
jgi:hypothetical protein